MANKKEYNWYERVGGKETLPKHGLPDTYVNDSTNAKIKSMEDRAKAAKAQAGVTDESANRIRTAETARAAASGANVPAGVSPAAQAAIRTGEMKRNQTRAAQGYAAAGVIQNESGIISGRGPSDIQRQKTERDKIRAMDGRDPNRYTTEVNDGSVTVRRMDPQERAQNFNDRIVERAARGAPRQQQIDPNVEQPRLLSGNTTFPDDVMSQDRRHLTPASQSYYDNMTKNFSDNFMSDLTEKGTSFNTVKEFEEFVTGVEGYDEDIGSYARNQAEKMLRKINPGLYQELQQTRKVDDANQQGLESFAARSGLDMNNLDDEIEARERYAAEDGGYMRDPVTGGIAKAPPVPLSPAAELRYQARDLDEEKKELEHQGIFTDRKVVNGQLANVPREESITEQFAKNEEKNKELEAIYKSQGKEVIRFTDPKTGMDVVRPKPPLTLEQKKKQDKAVSDVKFDARGATDTWKQMESDEQAKKVHELRMMQNGVGPDGKPYAEKDQARVGFYQAVIEKSQYGMEISKKEDDLARLIRQFDNNDLNMPQSGLDTLLEANLVSPDELAYFDSMKTADEN